MIKYNIIPYDNTEKIVYSFIVEAPFQKLSVISNLFEDLDDFIEWLEDLIRRNIPDFSENGAIIYQGFSFGSNKSKIIDLNRDGTVTDKEEFLTKDLLQLCKEWRDFLIKNKD